jgi:hypothetical protein
MPTQPFAVPAVILFVVAVPLVFGLVPRNRFYGFRTPKTLSDENTWYAVNRIAGVAMMIASGIYSAVVVIRPYERAAIDNFSTWWMHLAAFIVPVIIGLSLAGWYSKNR